MTDEYGGLDREPKVAFFFETGISINKINYVIVRCGETISNLWDSTHGEQSHSRYPPT